MKIQKVLHLLVNIYLQAEQPHRGECLVEQPHGELYFERGLSFSARSQRDCERESCSLSRSWERVRAGSQKGAPRQLCPR